MDSCYYWQEYIRDKLCLALVTCGYCGAVIIVKNIEGDYTCPFCNESGDQCDYPDLYYNEHEEDK